MSKHIPTRSQEFGPAGEAVSHWWSQRLTAIALVPLGLWFAVAFLSRIGAGHEAVVQWLSSPVAATLLILFLIAMFYHTVLGVQVVIEDYVHNEWAKLASLITLKLLSAGIAIGSIVATLRLTI